MKSSISNYEQELYINTSKIDSVDSAVLSYAIPVQHVGVIGSAKFRTFPSGAPSASLSVSKYLVPSDMFLGFTSESAVSGHLKRGAKEDVFSNAYLTNLSVSCSVGTFPKLAASFSIYGDVGDGTGTTGGAATSAAIVTRPGDITITCNGSSTNRVEAFSYDVSCQRNPIYKAIDRTPNQVTLAKPRQVAFQFTVGADDYTSRNLFDYSVISLEETVTIAIAGLATFTATDAELVSETFSGSSQDEMTVTLNYTAWL